MENQLVCKVGILDGKPHVHITLGNRHIGIFWGTIRETTDEFEKEHGIVNIVDEDGMIVSILWNVGKIIEEVKQ